jgi:L-serine dehydratase
MIQFNTILELIALAENRRMPLSALIRNYEEERSGRSSQAIWEDMNERLRVMKTSVSVGLKQTGKSISGLVGGDASRLSARTEQNSGLIGLTAARAASYALAISEVNANMGLIVACPTAGSCGIVPAALFSAAESLTCDDNALIDALFTAAGIGMVIAENATVAGAVGGCQAECGAAAAMAAGAVVEMAGGTPRQSGEALALALKNMLGLVCDPVAGLVEVPCVKRSAFAAVHALLAAEMALAGIESVIPADEVIDAMYQIGLSMPKSLRETSEGGLAKTPTGIRISQRLSSA